MRGVKQEAYRGNVDNVSAVVHVDVPILAGVPLKVASHLASAFKGGLNLHLIPRPRLHTAGGHTLFTDGIPAFRPRGRQIEDPAFDPDNNAVHLARIPEILRQDPILSQQNKKTIPRFYEATPLLTPIGKRRLPRC